MAIEELPLNNRAMLLLLPKCSSFYNIRLIVFVTLCLCICIGILIQTASVSYVI